jgi:glycosyltransferase involved in cell wall biosynthesis
VLAIGTLGLGGTEAQLTELALGIHRRGRDVRVAALFDLGPHAERLTGAGIEIFRGEFRDPSRHVAWDVALFPVRFARFVRWLRQARPATIHAFLYHAYVPSVFAARLAGLSMVITGRRSLSNFIRGRRFALALDRVANRCTDLVVANADAVADDAHAVERLPWVKLVVIRNGAPRRFFEIVDRVRAPGDALTILCVANLLPYKGHADLIDACALVAETGARFTLRLVGDGPERAALEQRASSSGADVVFLGACTDVAAVLGDADIVASASHEEGLSNSLLEAMAAGRAVVATDVGGTRELLGDAGILVPARDPAAFAHELERLIRDERHRQQLGVAARARAHEHFSLDRMVDAHLELYDADGR